MEKDIADILTRLQRRGTSALDLLPAYRHSDYEPFWRYTSELYQAFVRKLIDEGHPTRAFELGREGLIHHQGDPQLSYLLALASARGGNISEAECQLSKLLERTDVDEKLQTLAVSLQGRLCKDRYERTTDAARKAEWATRSAAAYGKATTLAGADYFPIVNAATMFLLSGESLRSKELACTVIEQVQKERQQAGRTDDYWPLAALGEAYLLIGDLNEAASCYSQAVTMANERGDVGSIAAMRRNALLLREKLAVSDELMRLFYVGSVVIFSGHMLDKPTRATKEKLPPRFPPDPQLIRAVSSSIKESLADLNATIGYCSAACGADILFAEQMLDRHAELHIVLPFARDDFYGTSVDFGSPDMKQWRARFEALLERATQVHYATTEAYLQHEVLFEFANNFMQGLAIIRALQRGVVPQALVLLDPDGPRRPGGTVSFLDTWKKGNYPFRTIDLAVLRGGIVGKGEPAPSTNPQHLAQQAEDPMERHIRSMLFADVKDFSKLREEYSPRFFVRFLQEVDGVLRSLRNPPSFSNTWGDGLYLVFDHVTGCAEAALRLLERAEQVDWKDLGFGATAPMRIGIHAGPVFSGIDPIIGRRNYFGSHVNRAARIEPVTMPGCAYASEQFAALLTLEPGHDLVCEYIGVEPLAKQYDRCPLYRLARR